MRRYPDLARLWHRVLEFLVPRGRTATHGPSCGYERSFVAALRCQQQCSVGSSGGHSFAAAGLPNSLPIWGNEMNGCCHQKTAELEIGHLGGPDGGSPAWIRTTVYGSLRPTECACRIRLCVSGTKSGSSDKGHARLNNPNGWGYGNGSFGRGICSRPGVATPKKIPLRARIGLKSAVASCFDPRHTSSGPAGGEAIFVPTLPR